MISAMRTPSGPKLRVRQRRLHAARLLYVLRWTVTLALVLAMVGSLYQRFTQPYQVGALEFTPHTVGTNGDARGVWGIDSSDIDADGDIDIIAAGTEGIFVYENTGNEIFERKVIDSLRGIRVQIVDLDSDGQSDILATLDNTPGVIWYRNDGDLEFSGTFIGSGKNTYAYAADLNKDGHNDIAVAAEESSQYVVRRWINDGSGVFASDTLPSTGNPIVTALTVGDISGSLYPDVLISGEGGLQRFDTSDGVTYNRVDVDDSNTNGTALAVADVTNDDVNDIIVGKQSGDDVFVYKHIENLQYEQATLSGNADATTIEVRDLDEDGDEDIIVAGQDDDKVFWYENNGTGSFTQRTLASGLSSILGITINDFDNDNDFDFGAADHTRGTIYWYERTRARPVATKPSNINQASDGSGRVTFETTISDADFEETKIRVQYSLDGKTWEKPWLTSVVADNGSVDLQNSNGFQVGTANGIDTDSNGEVTLTMTWDTKTTKNTGGALPGDFGKVQLRITPRDSVGDGDRILSSQFRVDNAAPTGADPLVMNSINEDEATLSWTKPTDSSAYSYKLYFGTDHAAVLEQRSALWDAKDDPDMDDIENTSTTVTELSTGKTYTFKLFIVDVFGNQVGLPSIRGTATGPVVSPPPTPEATAGPAATLAPGATATPTPEVTIEPTAEPSPTSLFETPTPTPTPIPTETGPPSTTDNNTPPVADAGLDQVVNPAALVILDGTASTDDDNDPLSFAWRQISGPVIELLSERTPTPSFSAGEEGETYIFSLTVRDQVGASATDTVTIATKTLPPVPVTPVDVVGEGGGEDSSAQTQRTLASPLVTLLLRPLDIVLFLLAVLLTLISLIERYVRKLRGRESDGDAAGTQVEVPKGRVVHYRTGEPIAGTIIMVYGSDGKLRSRERANAKGEFSTLFPAGQYTLGVQAENFTFSPAASPAIRPEQGILYSGGKITVPEGGRPLSIVVPMKPTGAEVSSIQSKLLHWWQNIQKISRLLSWPIFIVGALLNTVLIFWVPGALFLIMEVLYVILVIVKVALEVRIRPAYGLVRDSITHIPVDLAVVRLFEQGTNRLIMTRVTDSRGRFFALPPSGTYTVTITKPGFAVFSRDNVTISGDQDSVLQMTADLMPVAPSGGLAQARAAVL